MKRLKENAFGLLLTAALLACTFAFAPKASASCGLDYCPIRIKDDSKRPLLQLRLVPRLSSFTNGEVEGHFVENILRFEFLAIDKWRFGAWVAPIYLKTEDIETTGLSNPVLFAERVLYNPGSFQLRGALQAELPLGSSSDGLASSHSELLPYVSLSTSIGRLQIHGQAGVAIGLEGGSHGHEGEEDPHGEDSDLLVNPHAAQEVLSRLAIMGHVWHGLVSPGVHLNGRHSIQGSSINDVLSVNGVALVNLSKHISLIAQFEVPVNENPRFNWRTGFGIDLKL